MKNMGFEVRKLTEDDLSLAPSCYKGDRAELTRHLNWCLIFLKEEDNPYFYMRNMEPDHYRWGGIVRLADEPLLPHRSVHYQDLAQKGTAVYHYRKIADSPAAYRINSDVPFSEFTYQEAGAQWKEGDVLDLQAEYFPYAIFVHTDSPQKIDYWHQFVMLKGKYQGKKIETLGCFDRLFSPKDKKAEMVKEATTYIWSYFSGIRKDGRKECAYANIHERNGRGIGFYWIEGEAPILSDEVYLEAEWHRLLYTDKEDPTVNFTHAVWRFASKEIHCNCRWGSKGFLDKPRLETVGLSQTYGPWYEGRIPYKHQMWFNINENMGMTVEKILEMGFEIIE